MRRVRGGGEGQKRARSARGPKMLFVPEPRDTDTPVISRVLAMQVMELKVLVGDMPLGVLKDLHKVIFENKPSGDIEWLIKPYLGFFPEIRAIQDENN